MNEVVIGLGSNIQPDKNIQKAKFILYTHFTVIAVSKFVSTTPIGPFTKHKYINGCLLIKTKDEMSKLKDQLKKIEKDLGREKTVDKFAPRTIDLDIIVWNKKIVDPDFYTRDFLKNAVLELIPDLKIGTGI